MEIPQKIYLQLGQQRVLVLDDSHSDRVRCDHPNSSDGRAIAYFLIGAATCHGRTKVLTMVDERLIDELRGQGFTLAGTMPRFYGGERACGVLTYNLADERRNLANPKEVARAEEIFSGHDPLDVEEISEGTSMETVRAKAEDAERIAELIDKTFFDYPTPSHDPDYIRAQILEGTPFRFIEEEGRLVACASADLIREARTAELTDCATLPEFRKRGFMLALLTDLISDLEGIQYKSAFTYARARVPGINVLFKKLGFEFCGSIHQSCRIGEGLEDMNMWIRDLPLGTAEKS